MRAATRAETVKKVVSKIPPGIHAHARDLRKHVLDLSYRVFPRLPRLYNFLPAIRCRRENLPACRRIYRVSLVVGARTACDLSTEGPHLGNDGSANGRYR